jgi:hypothetical protein
MKQDSADGAKVRRGAGNEGQRKCADDPNKPEVLETKDPTHHSGKLKRLGGSSSDDWNNRIANEAINTLWIKNSDEETRHRQMTAAIDGLSASIRTMNWRA